ncbi:MAG TPA: HAD-IIIA family hydrolase [Candidatus Baltobacteraceae bacterium]|nr:HAD-IIIA family hydrolase [Candidatus Baltobacteraceae bacterium]
MIRAVLFDRDGTLIADGEGSLTLMPGAVTAISRLRERGIRIAVITNQPRPGTDLRARRAMHGLHHRIETRIGSVDGWFVCTHAPDEGCSCRKPQPGLIFEAARALGVAPNECAVIGDIEGDMEAARRAGAQGILVPTPVTRVEEVARARVVCRDLLEAVERVLAQAAA